MFRVVEVDNPSNITGYHNFYDIQEAQDCLKELEEKGINVKLETVKPKCLICDSIVRHNYPDYDYYVKEDLDAIKYIVRSLLLGSDHIELFKLNSDWQTATGVIDVIPLLDGDYSVESIMYHGFNKIYPQSRFLSSYIVNLFDKYDTDELTKEELLIHKDKLIDCSFDKEQKQTIKCIFDEFLK